MRKRCFLFSTAGGEVADAAARLLDLLTTLQLRPLWNAAELAERFGVTERTIRNDVERLRNLGYPIRSVRGRAGGYRFGADGRLPPLLLEEDEAVAMAIGLTATDSAGEMGEASVRARVKLEQLLPASARALVDAISTTTDYASANLHTDAPDPAADPAAVARIAAAIHHSERLRYRDRHGTVTTIDPHRLLSWQHRWYVVGRDPESSAWTVLRVDAIALLAPTRRGFSPSSPPENGYVAFAIRHIASTGWAVHARLRIEAPAARVLSRINPAVGIVEAVGEQTSLLHTGADSVLTIAAYIGMLDIDFTIESPPELIPLLRQIADRYRRATAPTVPSDGCARSTVDGGML